MAIITKQYSNGMIFRGDVNNSLFHPTGRSEFNNYNVEQTGYNQKLFDYYINHFQYSNAYKYASMFHYKDPEKELDKRAELIGVRMNNAKREALAKNIVDEKQSQALDFTDAIFSSNGLAYLNPENNSYVKAFEDYKNDLGSTDERKASKVSVTFSREKQTLFGTSWLDWLVHDNPNNYKNFTEEFGYNDDYLINNGVNIDNNNGEVTLTFDKSNPISNKLLYDIASSQNAQSQGALNVKIKGYDDNGEIEQPRYEISNPLTDFYNMVSHAALNRHLNDLRYMRDTINDATRQKQSLEISSEGNGLVYSSRIYGFSSDKVAQLWRAYEYQEDTQIRTQIKALIDHENETLYNQLMGIGLSNYEVTTDYFKRDGVLHKTTSAESVELKNVLSEGLASGKAVFQDMESGGTFGTLVTIPAKNVGDDEKEKSEVNIFIKGFREKEIQKKIASDNTYAAIHELDLMESFGTNYELKDGRTIGVERHGTGKDLVKAFYVKDSDGNIEYVNQQDLLPLLEEEQGVDKIYEETYNKHINADGDIIDSNNLYEELRRYSIALTNNTYRNTDEITMEDLFDEQGNLKSLEVLRKDVNFVKKNKLDAAMRIYLMLMEQYSWLQ